MSEKNYTHREAQNMLHERKITFHSFNFSTVDESKLIVKGCNIYNTTEDLKERRRLLSEAGGPDVLKSEP